MKVSERQKFVDELRATSTNDLVKGSRFAQTMTRAQSASGLNVRDFAKQMGVRSAGTVYYWKSGEVREHLRFGLIQQVRNLFGAAERPPAQDLMFGDGI